MACIRPGSSDTRQAETTDYTSANRAQRVFLVDALFEQLPGAWNLDRRLQSTNATEPAGECVGTATFTQREPSVFINKDGKLEMASIELVYHEYGHFQMQQASAHINGARFPFSRKYVWRYQRKDKDQPPSFSIWFTKPGTEVIDYLFHTVNVTLFETNDDESASRVQLHGEGCHLCEDDLYSSSYTFGYTSNIKAVDMRDSVTLKSWSMLHEVRGPNKDQIIETSFSR